MRRAAVSILESPAPSVAGEAISARMVTDVERMPTAIAAERPLLSKVLLVHESAFELPGWQRQLAAAGIACDVDACSTKEALGAFAARLPDMVVVELTMAATALAFIDGLRQSDRSVPIMAVATQDDPKITQEALRLGASGCILKDELFRDLAACVREIGSGRRYLSHEVASSIALMRSLQGVSPLDRMSARELRTFELLAYGKCYEEIANELNVSYRTVASVSARLKGKLGARSLSELTRAALEHFPNARQRHFANGKVKRALGGAGKN